MTASLLFVGESPPAGAPPNFKPFDCASGTRLATIMLGLRDRDTLLDHVPRANIYDVPSGAKGCTEAWEAERAAKRGQTLLYEHAGHGTQVVVALGRRVALALGFPDVLRAPAFNWSPPVCATWRPYVTDVGDRVTVMYAPHPSGASSTLNDPTTRADVRAMLMPELILGVPSLRPWHFRLDDPSTLASLSAALSPLCPALGAAALVHADALHKARLARQSSPLLDRFAKIVAQQQAAEDPWDEPLRATASVLLHHNGAAVLADWFGVSGNVFKATAKQHQALNDAQSRSTMRATLAQYAAAGVA